MTYKHHPNTLVRYRIYKDNFNKLYNVERLRLDDVVDRICSEYGISESTLWRALRILAKSESNDLATQSNLY